MRDARIEVCEARDGSFYWLVRGRNGRVLCNGETHTRAANARRAADCVQGVFVEHAVPRGTPRGVWSRSDWREPLPKMLLEVKSWRPL